MGQGKKAGSTGEEGQSNGRKEKKKKKKKECPLRVVAQVVQTI
jgi:hypothetical protein